MAELLSICIPTYNRAAYLRELLEGLIPELEQTSEAAELVRLYISDNASTDGTREVVDAFRGRWPILYHRNPKNIGGDHNFAQMIGQAPGTYFWLLGDDEWIVRGFLAPLLRVLKTETHHLVILEAVTEDDQPYGSMKTEAVDTFPGYAAFVDYYRRVYPWKLMLHSFISMMVVRHASFDQALNRRMLGTVDKNYAHMYGVVKGLSRNPGSIHLQRLPSIRIRKRRALVDTSIPHLTYLWFRYYRWLGRTFGHADLIAYGRALFGWREWWLWRVERLKSALGRGPDILR